MDPTPPLPGRTHAAGIRCTRQMRGILATGVVTGSGSDIRLHVDSPCEITLDSSHIPGFSRQRNQWMVGEALTGYGEQEVTRLFEIALALRDAVRANREALLGAIAERERDTLPLHQAIADARENVARVKRERRDAERAGGAHDPHWQRDVLAPAKARLAQAEDGLDAAGKAFKSRLADILGIVEPLPGGATPDTVRQLLASCRRQ